MPKPIHYVTHAGPEAMARIQSYLERMGEPPLNPALSIAWTAEDDEGVIHAMGVVQSIPLAEPFFAEPGYGICLKELFNMARQFILDSGAPRVLMHSSYAPVQRRLEDEGAREIRDPVYDWRRPK